MCALRELQPLQLPSTVRQRVGRSDETALDVFGEPVSHITEKPFAEFSAAEDLLFVEVDDVPVLTHADMDFV